MRRYLVALTLSTMLFTGTALALPAAETHAAPAGQGCYAGAVTQHDMAGTYYSTEYAITVELYGCGGALVAWDNAYGRFSAIYYATQRVPGEGVIARRAPDTVECLDSSVVIGFKAAERGYIQVFTTPPSGAERVYRLQKIS
jgi:hypothetical protein